MGCKRYLGRPSPFSLRFDAAEIAERVEGEPALATCWRTAVSARPCPGGAELRGADIAVLAPGWRRLEIDPGQAQAVLADGRVVQAPLVVAADGRGSTKSRRIGMLGIGVVGWPYRQSGVVATVDLQRPHQGVAHEHFLPSGPFAILPLTGNRASLVWTERTAAQAEALMAVPPGRSRPTSIGGSASSWAGHDGPDGGASSYRL